MGLDHDPCGRVFGERKEKHLAERITVTAARLDRGVLARLVDHQNIARLGRGKGGVVAVVFRDVMLAHHLDPRPRAVQKGRIIERIFGQDPFQIGFRLWIEMDAVAVDIKANRRVTVPPEADGPQKAVLDPDNA